MSVHIKDWTKSCSIFQRVSLNLVLRVQRLQRAIRQSGAALGAVRGQRLPVSSSVAAFPRRMMSSSYRWYWYTVFVLSPSCWWVNWYWSGWKQSDLSLMLHDKFVFSAEIKQWCFLFMWRRTLMIKYPKRFIHYFKIEFAFDWLCAVRGSHLRLTDDEKEVWLPSP